MRLQRIGHNWATFISSYWAWCPPLGLELLYLCSTQEHWLLLGDRQEDPYKGIQWGWWHWDDRLSWACVNQPNIWWTFTLPHEASFFSGFTHPLLCSYASMMVFFHISIISSIHLHYFFFFGHDLSTVVYLTQISPSLFSSARGSPMFGSISWWLIFQENTVLLTWVPTQKPDNLKMSPRGQAELSSNPPSFTSWFCILGCRWLGFSLSGECWFPCVHEEDGKTTPKCNSCELKINLTTVPFSTGCQAGRSCHCHNSWAVAETGPVSPLGEC